MSNDELIAAVRHLAEENARLKEELADAESRADDAEDERNAKESREDDRLRDAADLLVKAGYIHDTPHAKRMWILSGEGVIL